ncbi:MAG: efflux RND transporter permease subunit [Puniceicoccales bacterium]
MQRLFKFCYDYAYAIFGIVLALTALSIWQAFNLNVSVSTESLIPKGSPLQQEYERVVDDFGSDQLALVYVEDPELFTPEKLELLKGLSKQLQKLPAVERVESLFSVSDIRSVNGWIDTSPLLRSIPSSQEAIDAKQAQAIDNPLMRRTIISDSGDATLITLYLAPSSSADGAAIDRDREVFEQIDELLNGRNEVPPTQLPHGAENMPEAVRQALEAKAREQSPQPIDYTQSFQRVFQVGSPALHVWMADYIIEDQKVLLPAACLVLVILIGLLMGSFQAAIIPVVNAIVATSWTFGMMVALDIPITMLNYIVPALILIIGATEDVHVINEYREAKEEGILGSAAVMQIAQRIGLTLFLTGLTTSLGFAVTGLNALAIMQEFGLTAAIGMVARFLISITFLPAWLRVFGRFIPAVDKGKKHETKHHRLTERVGEVVQKRLLKNQHKVIAVFALIALPCLLMVPKIQVSNDLMSFLRPDSPIVERLDLVANELSGSKVIYVTFKGSPGDYKKAAKLQQIEAFSNWLREDPRLDTVTSLADYIALVNKAMKGGDAADQVVPSEDNLVAQYLVFFHRSDLKPYVTGNFSTANIVIRCNISDSSELNRLAADIEEKMYTGDFGRHSISVTGKAVMVASAVDKIIGGQVVSLSSMTLLLFIIVGILFLSTRAASLAVLSNLFPVVVVFGVMALFDVSLNVGTCMVAAITIGIAVDDTLHLMVRYNQELKRLKDEHRAILAAVKAEFFPVLTTSLGLAGGFIILGFSSFVPVMQFGLLSALVMMLAVIADIILTPVLLSTTRLITLWDVLGFNLRNALLERSEMFAGLTKWQAKKLILLATLEEREINEYIVREGDVGDSVYVIIDGELEVTKNIDGNRVVLSKLKLGDVFGEVALISDVKRTADVSCTTDTRLLVLNWQQLENLQKYNPFLSSRLFLNLSRILGQRLKSSLERMESPAPFPTRTPFRSRRKG